MLFWLDIWEASGLVTVSQEMAYETLRRWPPLLRPLIKLFPYH